ncbi:hypothetical protein K1719_033311 [Acacia pycnantha]|nr:hypothetical protein K1719_033311 [Acacia pycnantha]
MLTKNNEVKKTKRGETEELTYLEEVEGVKESEIDMLKIKKRKKENKKEQLQMEQVKEMKTPPNFLFGSLYSPIKFGNGDDSLQDGIAKGSDSFFTDRSANSVLSAYDDDDDVPRFSPCLNFCRKWTAVVKHWWRWIGHIYHWDLRTMTCIHKGNDEGCINGTALCASLGGELFVAGSDVGVVNIYNREEFLGGKRKPLKTIDNFDYQSGFHEI